MADIQETKLRGTCFSCQKWLYCGIDLTYNKTYVVATYLMRYIEVIGLQLSKMHLHDYLILIG